jgi:ABC-2 type transport system permease protein
MSMFGAAKALLVLRLKWELAFRVDAGLQLLASLFSLLAGWLLFEVTLRQVGPIGGWGRPEVLALVGTWSLLFEMEKGLLRGYRRLPGLVRNGRLEMYLLRPLPASALLICRDVSPALVWRLPVSLLVVVYAVTLAPPPLERVVLYGLSCVLSLAIYALLAFCVLCLSFWVIQMNNLSYVVYDLADFARYPASVYRGGVRVLLSTLLPFAILANVPVQMLMRGESPSLLLQQFLVLLGFSTLALLLWRKGLHAYQGAGR